MTEYQLVNLSILGVSLYVDKSDPGISQSLIRGKPFGSKWHREPEFMDLMEKAVERGDTVLDLGANLGYATVHLAKFVGETGRVIAVEPSQKNFEILQKNIQLNGIEKISTAFNLAIADKVGQTEFHLADETNLHSFLRTKHSKRSVTVQTETIDSLFERIGGFPNFIKMDVEGAEVEVLRGLCNLLQKHSDKRLRILMEIHPGLYDGDAFEEQLRRLFASGFQTKYVVSTGDRNGTFFSRRGYQSKARYRSGDWVRHIFEDVLDDDCVEACKTFDAHKMVFRHPLTLLRRPHWLIANRRVSSPKIVRSIMIERH